MRGTEGCRPSPLTCLYVVRPFGWLLWQPAQVRVIKTSWCKSPHYAPSCSFAVGNHLMSVQAAAWKCWKQSFLTHCVNMEHVSGVQKRFKVVLMLAHTIILRWITPLLSHGCRNSTEWCFKENCLGDDMADSKSVKRTVYKHKRTWLPSSSPTCKSNYQRHPPSPGVKDSCSVLYQNAQLLMLFNEAFEVLAKWDNSKCK